MADERAPDPTPGEIDNFIAALEAARPQTPIERWNAGADRARENYRRGIELTRKRHLRGDPRNAP